MKASLQSKVLGPAALFLLATGSRADAVETRGRLDVGTYQSQSRLGKPFQGSASNGKSIVSSRLKASAEKLGTRRDELHLELRDKFDLYGTMDPELLQLDSANELQLREAAYRSPYTEHRLYFGLGRFPLREAGIRANDGVELGYRLSSSSRAGVFAGQLPWEEIPALAVRPADGPVPPMDRSQGGVYHVYVGEPSAKIPALYTAHALLTEPNALNPIAGERKVVLHHVAQLSLLADQRLFSYLDFEAAPQVLARRARLSYSFFTVDWRARAYAYQARAEDLPLSREVFGLLAPSPLRAVGADAQWQLSKSWSLTSQLDLARRSADLLLHREFLGGVSLSELPIKGLVVSLAAGRRDLYTTRGTLVKLGLNVQSSFSNLRISQIVAREVRTDTGERVDPQLTSIDAELYADERLRGSAAVSYLKSRQQTTTAFLLVVGTGFGKRRVPPARNQPVEFEGVTWSD